MSFYEGNPENSRTKRRTLTVTNIFNRALQNAFPERTSKHPKSRKDVVQPPRALKTVRDAYPVSQISQESTKKVVMNPPMPGGMNVNDSWVVEMSTPVSDACIFAKNIPTLQVPERVWEEKEIMVFVTQVHSPYKFWFNVHLGESSSETNELLSDMHTFYDELSDHDYKIHPTNVCIGRACVTQYNRIWHRCEILTDLDAYRYCYVYFIDYGTIQNVHVSGLRYLKACFSKVPRQALRGRLALVAPPQTDLIWRMKSKSDATFELCCLCADQLLHGFVYAYEEAEQIFHLILVDPNFAEPLVINEALKFYGFGRYLKPKNDIFPHPDEIFPTFEMLETGKFPHYTILATSDQMAIYNTYRSKYPEALNVRKTRTLLHCMQKMQQMDDGAPPPYNESWAKPQIPPKIPPPLTAPLTLTISSNSSTQSSNTISSDMTSKVSVACSRVADTQATKVHPVIAALKNAKTTKPANTEVPAATNPFLADLKSQCRSTNPFLNTPDTQETKEEESECQSLTQTANRASQHPLFRIMKGHERS